MQPQSISALRLLTLAALTATLAACGGGDDDDGAGGSGWQSDGNVKLQFAAYNGSTPIDCSSSLKLGTKNSAVKMQDFRFYVSNVKLVREDGVKVALKLKATDDFNYSDATHSVSLIDLEQKGTGACAPGTPALNPSVEGTVPAGRYTGVELTLGVPFELNHLDQRDAATPAALRYDLHPGMSWNWRGGRKFTKIEFAGDAAAGNATGVLLHLGSSGCVGDPANGTPISSCKAPNHVPVTLAGFNPAQQSIAVDAGALFNYDFTPEGENACMAGPTDTACVTPFDVLGLDWKADGSGNGQPVKAQRLFRPVAK